MSFSACPPIVVVFFPIFNSSFRAVCLLEASLNRKVWPFHVLMSVGLHSLSCVAQRSCTVDILEELLSYLSVVSETVWLFSKGFYYAFVSKW